MAEVSFDTLEALARRPVPSVAGTKVSGYVRFVTVNGPFKTEYNIYQQGASDDFANEDTFVSGLVTPIAAEVAVINHDGTALAIVPTCTLEADQAQSTYRTVRVFDADAENGAGIIVKVHGF